MNIVPTKKSFTTLLNKITPDIICDVGSRNAHDCRLFQAICTEADCYAFEANEVLAKKIADDPLMEKIKTVNAAVYNENGLREFCIADKASGNGSLRNWNEFPTISTQLVKTIRLDTYFKDQREKSIALWVDAEGCGFEVLQGCEKIFEQIVLIHIEVETASVWYGQKTFEDIIQYLEEKDFILVNQDFEDVIDQGDLVFVAKKSLKEHRINLLLLNLKLWTICVAGSVLHKTKIKEIFPAIHYWMKGVANRIAGFS